jgi:hypothetical protein
MQRFENYHFKGQRNEERILRIYHRHWFVILVQFLLLAFALTLVIGSFLFITVFFPELSRALGSAFVLFLETTFLIFIWFYAFLAWIDYYLDVWIITDQRIVNIEQNGLFARQVSELEFSSIQDVTTEVTGFIPTVLNFGDVYVQTAGERERFVFEQVPDPYAIKGIVMEMHRKANGADRAPERHG